ncbi:MAG: 16S rRNA (guanine(966)-N(2))-methyltransferase RsmD [Legionella sp.]|nr:16S rRNA (guanine(966)-N(2))-methyltransferase RsmD [Legionella sp.]
MNHSVRIIGGLYRGKKINFPDIEGLRPTPDRVKETLFNWLMHDIRRARCLDAFAGSGALGFEAFSRGACNVVMIESSPIAFKALQQTARAFDKPEISVLNLDARLHLQTVKDPYDIIFLDPPFKSNYLEECLTILASGNCLIKGGLVYIESAVEITVDSTIWNRRKFKKAGQVFYALLEKC